jgi:hypothetical protein
LNRARANLRIALAAYVYMEGERIPAAIEEDEDE